ncbi:hypothetical protein FisN_18Hh222 [Fistulifera solaris]|jgi:hypothetical protein|uniref:Uncharacterized protein n=1 Tax=Fistulifera solaris TaxID=1519565 RepID=A0A1Z5JVR2_FISSO|nr:hypothetical protein FisN_18Hh222 [Fistulifera solaris]|eukprot:GAX18009.1 hypothetical protein FisN_18Hh222 [Fistulifera solaris]
MSDSDSDIYIEDDPSFEERAPEVQPVLQAVEKLRHLPRQKLHIFQEFQLTRSLESVKDFLQLFQFSDDKVPKQEYDAFRYIWINSNAFVRYFHIEQCGIEKSVMRLDDSFPAVYQNVIYSVVLQTTEGKEYQIDVHASSYIAAAEFLSLICRLSDDWCSSLSMSCYFQIKLCPLSEEDIRALRSNDIRETVFRFFVFNPKQAAALVSSPSSLCLHDCSCSDGGASMVHSLRLLKEPFHIPKITIRTQKPFDEENWNLFLGILADRKIVHHLNLTAYDTAAWSSNVLLSQVQVKDLSLTGNAFEDCKLPLIESIRTGVGPLGIHMDGFGTLAMWKSFGEALRSPECVLQRLTLYKWDVVDAHDTGFDRKMLQAKLISFVKDGLLKNQSLIDIDFSFAEVFDGDLEMIFDGVRHHKALTKMTLTTRIASQDADAFESVPRTIALGHMLENNKMIRDVNLDECLYDKFVWRKVVEPMKERNGVLGFMKKFHNIPDEMIRAWFLCSLLEKKSNTVVYMLLKMNSDVLSIYVGRRSKGHDNDRL